MHTRKDRFDSFAAFIASVSDEGLTDARLLELSKQLFKEDVMDLGIKGLGIPELTIERHFQNNPNNIQQAVYVNLRQWRRSQKNATVALENICKALRDADMQYYIDEVLK